jgi:GGDEF domain-containing protein
MQLVGQRRLRVLADLLEAGRVYRGMTKSQLRDLVKDLQPQVDQLGHALSLELIEERDYNETLLEAHRQMAELSEQVAGRSVRGDGDDQAYAELLAHTNELSGAVEKFLNHPQTAHGAARPTASPQAAVDTGTKKWIPAPDDFARCPNDSALARKLVAAATRCRERRQELSLIMMETNVFDMHSDPFGEQANRNARLALAAACSGLAEDRISLVAFLERRCAAIVSNCDRSTALSIAQASISELGKIEVRCGASSDAISTTLCVGVATASIIARNFDSMHMIESATRCLNASRACGISTVKSIEV